MDKNEIAKKLDNVVFQLDGMVVPGHENRKRAVIAVEMLVQLMDEINKENPGTEAKADEAGEKAENGEVKTDETAETQ